MPSLQITRMLVVAIVLCSTLAGKALADSTGPPVDDPNQTLGQYLDTHPIVWHDKEYSDPVPPVWLGNDSIKWIRQDGGNTFNITMDSCVPMDAIVGIYQFANGTSKNDTTLYEISQDLLVFAYEENDVGHRLRRFASQLLANAQLAVNDINAFLDNHVLCSDVTVSVTDHNELRRLLVEPNNLPDGYWATLIVKSLVTTTVAGVVIATNAATNSAAIRAGVILPFVFIGVMINGALDQAQRNGKMNWLDAFLGSVVLALMRRQLEQAAGIGTIDACNESNSNAISNPDIEGPESSMTSYQSAISVFESEHPAQGLPCQS